MTLFEKILRDLISLLVVGRKNTKPDFSGVPSDIRNRFILMKVVKHLNILPSCCSLQLKDRMKANSDMLPALSVGPNIC